MITLEQSKERENRMKQAAFLLFKEKGIEKVTMQDVSKFAGVGEASVYRYFNSKANLLFETYRMLWKIIADEFNKATIYQKSFMQSNGLRQMQLLIDAFEEIYLQHVEFLRFAVGCKLYWTRTQYIVDSQECNNIVGPIIRLFKEVLLKGVEDGTVQLWAEIDSCCFSIWGILRAYVEQSMILDNYYSGENRYQTHYQTTKAMILKAIQLHPCFKSNSEDNCDNASKLGEEGI